MEKEKIQTKFKFQEVNSYGDAELNVPEGYQFLQFIEKTSYNQSNGFYGSTMAVFVEYKPMLKVIEEMKIKNQIELDKKKDSLNEDFKKRVGDMQLEETFSDILKKFKIGDTVYYYNDYVGNYGSQEKIEDHIKSFTLYDITLRSKEVRLRGETNTDYDAQLVLVGWGEETKPEKAFRTKEEAILGSKDYHDNRLKEKKEQEEKNRIALEEKKRLEEAEILRKAEEIKNKKV